MCNENKKEFVSLHNHSEYSILDGYARIIDYVKTAKERNSKGIGLTDHGTMSGIYEMIQECNKAGIQPVPGFEAYVAPENPEGAFHKGPIFYGLDGIKAPKYDVSGNGAYLHLTLWAYNEIGLKNLYTLTSLAGEESRFYQKPRIDTEMLFKYSEGLIVTTGCPSSEVSTRFLLGQDDKAYEYASRLKSVFGEHMFVEVMDHNMEDENLERILLPKLVKLSEDLDIPLLATNDSHYVFKEDADDHERMLAMQTKRKMSEPSFKEGGTRFAFSGPEYYLKTDAEMRELFPESLFPGAVDNTVKVVEMCDEFSLNYDPHLRPEIEIPEGYTEVTYLKKLILEGFKKKRGSASEEVQKESKKRIKEEFEVIHSNDFISYFLVVNDYIDWAHKNGVSTGTGRGCFMPHTEISLPNSFVKIKDITKDSKVKTFDNDTPNATNTFQYEVENQKMTRLFLSNGKVLESTDDHLLLSLNDGYIRADEVTLDTVLVGEKPENEIFPETLLDKYNSVISYPYTTKMYPNGHLTEITFPSKGLHVLASFAEATGLNYEITKLKFQLPNSSSPIEKTVILFNIDGMQVGMASVPDGLLPAHESKQFNLDGINMFLLNESDTSFLLMNNNDNQSPIEVVNIEKFVYSGLVNDIEVDNYFNYIAEGVIVHNSVGGSEIAYVLDISDTDPIRFDLLFERFLSPGRGSLYKIEYADGTVEEISVSEKKKVKQSDGSIVLKYIHELNDGDIIIEEDVNEN